MRRLVFLSLMVLGLASCSTNRPQSGAEMDDYYKTSLSPPAGYGRFYLFPALQGGTWVGTAELGATVTMKSASGAEVPVGETTRVNFVAFDVRAGTIEIRSTPFGKGHLPSAGKFTVTSGQTSFLRPISYDVAPSGGLVGAIIGGAEQRQPPTDTRRLQFEYLDEQTARSLMKDRQIFLLSEDAKKVARQDISADQAVPLVTAAPPAASAVTAPVSPPAPSQANDDVETVLAQLKRLYEKGLIEKSEYDAKRKELLNRIH
jgi:hypothetical protein